MPELTRRNTRLPEPSPLEAEYGQPGMHSMMALLVDALDELLESGAHVPEVWPLAAREDVLALWEQVPERDRMLMLGIAVVGEESRELPGPPGEGLDLARRLQEVARGAAAQAFVVAEVADLPVPRTEVALEAVVRLVAATREERYYPERQP